MAEDYPEQDLEDDSSMSLSSQLGTDSKTLALGKINMKILTVLTDPKNIPQGMRSLVLLQSYADVFGDKAIGTLVYNYLDLLVSIRGRGRRDLLKAEAVRKGGDVDIEPEIQQPGWLERNTWNRRWEDKEKERLGIE